MADKEKEIKLIISAYTKGAEDGLHRAQKAAEGFGGSNKTLATTLDSVKQAGSLLINALGPLAGALAVREVIQAAIEWDSYEKALVSVTGSQQAANEEMEFLRQVSEKLGLALQGATNGYINLAAAAKGTIIEGEATRQIFEAVAGSMAKLGKSSADTDAALLAISQMMSKGKVSAEELRGQLGERMPGAFKAFADAAGVSTAELDSMLQKGEVGIDLLPKFAAKLRETFDLDSGKIETAQASINRLNNSLLELKLAVANSGLLSAFTGALDDLSAAIQDPGLLDGFRLLGETIGGIGGEGEGFRNFVNSMVEGLKLLMLGAQTVLVPIKLLGETAAATFAAISLAIEGDFKGAMAVLQDSTPGDKFRADLERLEIAAGNIGSSFRTMGEQAAASATGITASSQALGTAATTTGELATAQTSLQTATDETAKKQDVLNEALKLTAPTADNLKAAVDKAAEAYYAAATAADALTEKEQASGKALKDLEVKRKAYTDAVKALNNELWQDAIYGFDQEETALSNSLKARQITLKEHLQLGIIDNAEYQYQIARLELENARQIVEIRQATMETAKEIYGVDSEEYRSAAQEKIEAELGVKEAALKSGAALDNIGTSAQKSADSAVPALDSIARSATEAAKQINNANDLANGFYANWDRITTEINNLSTPEDINTYRQNNRDYLNASGQLGNAYSNSLNAHATDLLRRQTVAVQEASREWVTLPNGQRIERTAATQRYIDQQMGTSGGGAASVQSLGTINLRAGGAEASVTLPDGDAGQQLLAELRRLNMVTV